MKIKTRISTGIVAVILGATSVFSVRAVNTELHDAVKEQNFSRVKTLCEEHPEWVNEFDNHWSDALSYAIENKDTNVVKCLVDNGTDVTRGLRCAMRSGDIDLVKYFVENGADINLGLWDAVHCFDDIDLVKYFVENGADVNIPWGRLTLLSCAHNTEMMEYLVNHGADINAQEGTGQPPLHWWACYKGDNEKFKWLIEHGADVNIKDGFGNVPLHYLVKDVSLCEIGIGDSDSRDSVMGKIDFLVKHGADVNAQDCYGVTLLFTAAEYGGLGVVQYLVEHGADVNAVDIEGKTLLNQVRECLRESKLIGNSKKLCDGIQSVIDYLCLQGAKE